MTPEEIALLQQVIGGGDKPSDPYGSQWTGDQRVAALRAKGYTWSNGNPPGASGPGALWVDPFGRVVPESAALAEALKAPAPPKAQEAPDRITSGGVVYERSADGTWRPAQGIPAVAGSGDSGVGWANLAENRRQFDITQQRQQASLEQQIRQTDAQIAAKEKELALQQANFDYLKTKDAYAQQTNDKRLALETNAQMFNQQQAIAGLNLQKAQMQAQRDSMVFQSQQDAAKFNAQMSFNVQQANQQAETQRQAQLQSLASSISEAARDPGDRGKLASLLLANGGWGQVNTAIGQGANLITEESQAPLESLLRTRQDVQNRPANPYSFTPIQTPSIPGLNLDALNAPTGSPAVDTSAGWQNDPMSVRSAMRSGWKPKDPNAITNPQVREMLGLDAAAAQPGTGAGGFDQAANNFAITQAAQSMGLPGLAHGGVTEGAYISGERGPELNIPLPGGGAMVLNQKQMKGMGINLDELMHFDDGGIFGGFGNVQDTDRTLSTNFLRDALAKARAGTPFNAGNLPAPVYASSPGFNPYITRLLGSLSAMGQGVPADLYADLAARYRPTGVTESVIRRSA